MDNMKERHARLGLYVLRLFPKVMQLIVKDNIPPGKLRRMFDDKQFHTVFTDAETNLLRVLPNMDDFTIEICYKILRFEHLIEDLTCKWDKIPHDTEVEIADDIRRIIHLSNVIIIKPTTAITESDFNIFDNKVQQIMKRVDDYLKCYICQTDYKGLDNSLMEASEIWMQIARLKPIQGIASIITNDVKILSREFFLRIAIIIIDIFPDILRDILQSTITASQLHQRFKSGSHKCVLFSDQKIIVEDLQHSNTFRSLDISLMYKLIRGFALITPPSQGWGRDPDPSDIVIADDVERIRLFRNKLAHGCETSIKRKLFDEYIKQFSEICKRVDNHFSAKTSYEQRVVECKTCTIDIQLKEKYEEAVKELENYKLQFERKPVRFYWGDTFERSLKTLRMLLSDKRIDGNEKCHVQIILQTESEMNDKTASILNNLKDEINLGLTGIEFLVAKDGSVVLSVNMLVKNMETDKELQIALVSLFEAIVCNRIDFFLTEYVDAYLIFSEENTLFEKAKKEKRTVIELAFNVDACCFSTDKKMKNTFMAMVENINKKSNKTGIEGVTTATVMPLQFDFKPEMLSEVEKDYRVLCVYNELVNEEPDGNFIGVDQETLSGLEKNLSMDIYEKKPGQRGLLLIINYVFRGRYERKGTEIDVKRLTDFFMKIGYQVIFPPEELTKIDLLDYVMQIERQYLMEKSNDFYAFVCVIMSSGSENGIETTDGMIQVAEITSIFKNKPGGNFNGKPKLFLIQACRGPQLQEKIEVSNSSKPISHDELLTFPEKRHLDDEILLQPTLEQEQSPYSSRDNNSDAFYNYKENMHKVPEDADVIVAYATTPGYISIRSICNGSFFIRAFLSVATKRYKDDDIEKILRAVRRELATNPEFEPQTGFLAGKCQMGMLESTSTKEFYL